jgi:hypothetical protein
MKPKHNRVMCPECFKQKMLFETQKQADNFIKWNGEDIDTNGGELRSYFCPACGGYHITSKPYRKVYEHNTENLIKRYEKDVLLKNRAMHIEIDLPKEVSELLENLPADIDSKTKLKPYIKEYAAKKGMTVQEEQDIRTYINKLIKSGKFNVKRREIHDNVLSDEDIFEFIKMHDISTEENYTKAFGKVRSGRRLAISKEQSKRLHEMWLEYLKTIGKADTAYSIYRDIIKEFPEIDTPQISFVRNLVDSYIKVNKIQIERDEINRVKRLALSYYFKKI